MEVPQQILEKYASRFGLTVDDLSKRYTEIYTSLSDANETVRRKKALLRLTNAIKRERGVAPNTDSFVGIILGSSPVEDEVENQRRIAERIFAKDKERAVREGYTNEDGVVLDRRDRVNFRDNPRKGLPLEGHDYRRTIVGIATKEGEENYRLFKMRLYREVAQTLDVPLNSPVQFRAIYKEGGEQQMTLNCSTATRFTPVEREIDVETILKEKKLLTPLAEVEQWYQFNKTVRQAICITEGSVYRMRLEPNPNNGRRSVTITEPEEPELLYTCSVPEHIPINFGEDSRVIVAGYVRPVRTGNRLWIDALGIYPLKDYFMPLV